MYTRKLFPGPFENFQMCHCFCPLRDYKSIETHGRIGTPQALYKSATSVGVPVRSLWIVRLCPHPLHRCLQFGLKGAVAPELLAYIV